MPQQIPAVSMCFLIASALFRKPGLTNFYQEVATMLYWVPIFSSVTNKCILPSRWYWENTRFAPVKLELSKLTSGDDILNTLMFGVGVQKKIINHHYKYDEADLTL